MTRYYSTLRPFGPGTFPQKDGRETITNFDGPAYCEEIGREAWGYIEYPEALTKEEAESYDLTEAGMKTFWCVTTSYDDRGRALSNITNTVQAAEKPKDTYVITRRRDIYNDWFESRKAAEEHVKGKNRMKERIYYEIDEQLARRAHEMMSFRDYAPGSKTNEYRLYADEAYDLVDRIERERPDSADRAYSIAVRYAKKLADNMNKESRIGTMCPSIMIAGGSNFPVRKKEKQNAASDNNRREFIEIRKTIDKLQGILNGKEIIFSDDENAIEKLEKKLEDLEALQMHMKTVNAYYRKHKTVEGCPACTPEEIERLKASMKRDFHFEDKPFASYALTNNNANINRIKKRLKALQNEKNTAATDLENDYFRATENKEEMRIQIFFDGKPEPEVREILKRNGFRWAPSKGAWQRHLNDSGRYALGRLVDELDKRKGEQG